MLKIRLARTGARKLPNYRVVVTDSRSPRNGRLIDNLGYYNPLTSPETVVIDAEKAQHWIKEGAQPTPATARLLAKLKTAEKPKSGEESS